MKKPLLILTLLIIGVYQHVQAQYMLGTTGMMNIPTADRQKPGTVMLGGNYLPKQVMPSRFNYNTGNYFVSISFFSFLRPALSIFPGLNQLLFLSAPRSLDLPGA